MMALVGHTSMQLACAQCLQTSLIMFQAMPPFGVVRSWNCTWRQFCSSSCPVLSKPSPNVGTWPGRRFHSLHATSQALQPMQSVVSVKKPTVRAMVALLSDRHEVWRDLGEAPLLDVEIERKRDQLVDDGDGLGVLAQVDGDDVTPAALAAIGAQMRQASGVGKDRQLGGALLAAADARHAGMHPALGAAAALQHSRTADQHFGRLAEVRHLRKTAAAWATGIATGVTARVARGWAE